jgi:hypothetical protein
MSLTFETLGNATILFMVDGSPILATDPWLKGTCYFGSWSLDHALTDEQINNITNAQYIWISHGHPDHLHPESLELIPKSTKLLIPDHYNHEIHDFLVGQGFSVAVTRYRRWLRLHDELEVLCLDNENQDSILVARFGNALLLNLNDSPLFGERPFLRSLIKRHPNDRVFVLQLCSVDADMRNFVDASGRRITPAPDELKPGAVREVARNVRRLGAKFFCCSSSQHLYVRSDSVWANEYRITYDDMQRYWNQPEVELVPPFVTVDLTAGTCTENHLCQAPDLSQITSQPGSDDWDEVLTEAEKDQVRNFFSQFVMLKRYLHFLELVVGGEKIQVQFGDRFGGRRGVTFFVPRASLLEAVRYGYFDDLLIGNFMRTQLHGKASLYPFITPLIAKLGGNAKVYTAADYLRFRLRYFRRNPFGFLRWRLKRWIDYTLIPAVRTSALRLNVFQPLKLFYRGRLLGDASPQSCPAEGGQSPLLSANGAVTARVWLPALTKEGKMAPARPDLSSVSRPRLIVSIDTEEDFDWTAPFSASATSVESIAQQEPAQRIIEQHGAVPIYLCDFPVAAQEPSYRTLREWQGAGRCSIGAHLHPWVNPPQVESINSTHSYPCNLPIELQREKLHILTETLIENTHSRPMAYKAGRYGGDLDLPALLKPLGYRIDMSINPIGNYSADGGPDHTAFPHAPFWLDPERELLSIPATGDVLGALRTRWVSLSAAMPKDTSDLIKLGWFLRRFGLINRVFLSPEGTPISEAKALTRFLVAAGHRVFTLGYHSTSLNPGSNPYVRNAADLRRFLGWLDAYLEFFFREIGGTPASPEAIYQEARLRPVTLAPMP